MEMKMNKTRQIISGKSCDFIMERENGNGIWQMFKMTKTGRRGKWMDSSDYRNDLISAAKLGSYDKKAGK
jgi:hypothetical protein